MSDRIPEPEEEFFEAIKERNYINVGLCIKKYGPNLKHPQDEMTALSAAAFEGDDIIVSMLIAAGANANIHLKDDQVGWTILMVAAETGNAECCKVLIDAGIPIDYQDIYGNSALIIAAYHGHLDFCKVLLDNNADINLKEEENLTAKMCASREGHSEIIKLLESKEMEVDGQVDRSR